MRSEGSAAPQGADERVHPVDAHVHVWDRSRVRIDWLDAVPELSASRLPAEYDGQRGSVAGVVFVQAGAAAADSLTEAQWVQSLAGDWPALRGLVADADLLDERLPSHLDALAELPLLRGVRHLLQDLPEELVRSERLAASLGELQARGLSFDACVRWWQLSALTAVLERTAPAAVVLDHAGKPPLDEPVGASAWREWERGLRSLASIPAVHVKLSGLAAEAASRSAFEALAPRVIDVVLDAFGPERVMFGSDWPVSAVGAAGVSTAEWLDLVRANVSDGDWEHLAAATAERFYKL